MKRLLALMLAAACFLPLAAQAQRLLQPAELQALAAPIARYPDVVIVDVAAAAADPARIAYLPYPELRDFLMANPAWAHDFAYAFSLQQGELWQMVQAVRRGPVAYYPAPVVVQRVYVSRPVVVKRFVVVHNTAVMPRNGAPSPAAQMQDANSAAYAARARALNQPSRALQMQQHAPQAESRAQHVHPYHKVPEAQRQPIVQQHYPQFERKRRP
jgi:hypothetical protein